jgi:type I restriction enzyme R subunit
MQHALGCADILQVPGVFSSNGDAFASHNKIPAAVEDIETKLSLTQFPSLYPLAAL